jgi:hypothetical protein
MFTGVTHYLTAVVQKDKRHILMNASSQGLLVLLGFWGLAPHENCNNFYLKKLHFQLNIMRESQQSLSLFF